MGCRRFCISDAWANCRASCINVFYLHFTLLHFRQNKLAPAWILNILPVWSVRSISQPSVSPFPRHYFMKLIVLHHWMWGREIIKISRFCTQWLLGTNKFEDRVLKRQPHYVVLLYNLSSVSICMDSLIVRKLCHLWPNYHYQGTRRAVEAHISQQINIPQTTSGGIRFLDHYQCHQQGFGGSVENEKHGWRHWRRSLGARGRVISFLKCSRNCNQVVHKLVRVVLKSLFVQSNHLFYEVDSIFWNDNFPE